MINEVNVRRYVAMLLWKVKGVQANSADVSSIMEMLEDNECPNCRDCADAVANFLAKKSGK